MTTTDFKTQLHSLIQLQRRAHTEEGVPDAATRRDRLTRAGAMLARASNAIAVAVSEDFGYRSVEETKFETFGAVNAFRHAAARVENWMQPAQHPALAVSEAVRITVPGGRVLVLDLRTHQETWVRTKLGDRTLGSSDDELKRMLMGAGLSDVRVGVGARKTGDPFTVLVASGMKPDTVNYEETKSRDQRRARRVRGAGHALPSQRTLR